MDLMTRRRALLARVESAPGIDTSPVIEIYGYRLGGGDPLTHPNEQSNNECITTKYAYTPSSSARVACYYGLGSVCQIFKPNGDYQDFWGTYSYTAPTEKTILNANSGLIQCSVITSMIDVCYMYIKATGDILFAGRNSIYYGHRNINELN